MDTLETTKNSTIYYNDGNIVLLSLPKDNTITAFKLYKELLLVHSAVFSDMLSMPLPQNVELYDGVPLVRLQDEAADLLPFLNALYDLNGVPVKQDFLTAEDKVRSIFKLSKKYQVEKLLTRVKNTLLELWPKTLTGWDNLHPSKPAGSDDDAENLEKVLPEPCYTIRLARDYDIPSILPLVFYEIFRTSEYVFSSVNVTCLLSEDIMAVLKGSSAIRSFLDGVYDDLVSVVGAEYCDRNRRCLTFLKGFGRAHLDRAYYRGEVLEMLRPATIENPLRDTLCQSCFSSYTEFIEEQRSDMWRSLPEFFGLEGTGWTGQ